jgi:lipoprotein-releasing system permease protein
VIWIEKQRNIIDFALSSLLRKWGKNLALLIVYMIIVFVLASVSFFTSAIQREASLVLQSSPEILVQRVVAGRHDLIPESYISALSKLPGVRNAKGRLWGYYFEPATGANYTLIASDDKRLQPGSIIIGRGVARTLNVEKGDLLSLMASDGTYAPYEVTDILSPESEIVSSDLIQISPVDFRAFFNLTGGLYTDITLQVRNKAEMSTIAGKIKNLFPDTRPILRDEVLRTYTAIFDWRAGLLLFILSGAVLAFAIFAWDKATSLSFEERREIGILKAVGWEVPEVILVKSWEGIVISLTAFLTGCITAYIHIYYASYIFFEPVLKGWSVLYPHFRLIPHVDVYQIAALFFLTVVPYTAATIIPSWRAAIIDPDAVMRL